MGEGGGDPLGSVFTLIRPQIRNVATSLCIDSKHGATGSELRLEACLQERAERTWAHEQVRASPIMPWGLLGEWPNGE